MPTLSETEVQDEYILLYLISNCWSTLRLSALLSVLCSHFSAALSWKLSERSIREYSAAPCAVCVCCVCVRASGATHTILNSSMDKRLYPSPSVLTHTQTHTEEQSRYLWAAEHAEGNTLGAFRDECCSLCLSVSPYTAVCPHIINSWKKNEWQQQKSDSQTLTQSGFCFFWIKSIYISKWWWKCNSFNGATEWEQTCTLTDSYDNIIMCNLLIT